MTKIQKFDVVIAGFGTAGALAAIAAARQGVRVLVLEKTTYPGGMQTGGGIYGYYSAAPEGGLMAEIDREVAETAQKYNIEPPIEARKYVLEQNALAAGARIVYESVVCGVLRDGHNVTGVIYTHAGEQYTVHALMVIDATADAVVARLAGCETLYGRDGDHGCNTFTNIALGHKDGGIHAFNFDAGRIDFRDGGAFARAMLKSYHLHLQKSYRTPVENACEVTFSDVPGVREAFRIVGERMLTAAETLDDQTGDYEVIGWAYSNLDCHMFDPALESRFFRDWMVGASLWGTCFFFPVCRKSMIPRGYQGLLVAGRHLSVEHDLAYAVRMNAMMGRLGEVAGAWAALCAKRHNSEPLAVSLAELETVIGRFADHRAANQAVWPVGYAVLADKLASDAPGLAIWVARRPEHRAWLLALYQKAAQGGNLKRHAAIALALGGDTASLPELRQMVDERDAFRPKSCRKYNFLRLSSAIYCLGRLADADSVERLQSLLCEHDLGLPASPYFNEMYNVHSLTLAALTEIGAAVPAVRQRAFAVIEHFINAPGFRLTTPLKSSEFGYDVGPVFAAYLRNQMAALV